MKTYEKQLEKLIALSDGGKDLVRQGLTGMDEKSLRFLAAKGVISLVPAGNNTFQIRVEHAGLTYFDNRSIRIRRFLWDNAIAFFALIIALISLIRTF